MIDFTENDTVIHDNEIWITVDSDKKTNLALCGEHLEMFFKHFGLAARDGVRWLYRRVVKKYPLAVIAAVLFVSFVTCVMLVGNARAERDKVTHELFVAQQKLDSYEAAMDK